MPDIAIPKVDSWSIDTTLPESVNGFLQLKNLHAANDKSGSGEKE